MKDSKMYSKDHNLSNVSFAWPPALHRLYYWRMDHNTTIAISSAPYWKRPSPDLERSTIIQEASA